MAEDDAANGRGLVERTLDDARELADEAGEAIEQGAQDTGNWFERQWDWLQNDSREWFLEEGGYRWGIGGFLGLFGLLFTHNAALGWAGGGVLGHIAAVPVAVTGAMVFAVLGTQGVESVYRWTIGRFDGEGEEQQQQAEETARQIAQARGQDGAEPARASAVSGERKAIEVAQADLGDFRPIPPDVAARVTSTRSV